MGHWAALAHIPAPVGGKPSVPPQLIEPSAQFFSRSALGICDARTNSLEAQLEQLLQSYAREEDRPALRNIIEARSLGFQASCTAGASALRIRESRDRLHRMQRSFANHDYAAVRALLDTVRQARRDLLPGEVSLDYTYQEAWLRAAMGDTAGAVSTLDLSLNALPSLGIAAIDEPAATAAIGRAFLLRAELAAKTKDRVAARRWASALAALWANADPDLQSEVTRMRALAGAN